MPPQKMGKVQTLWGKMPFFRVQTKGLLVPPTLFSDPNSKRMARRKIRPAKTDGYPLKNRHGNLRISQVISLIGVLLPFTTQSLAPILRSGYGTKFKKCSCVHIKMTSQWILNTHYFIPVFTYLSTCSNKIPL